MLSDRIGYDTTVHACMHGDIVGKEHSSLVFVPFSSSSTLEKG